MKQIFFFIFSLILFPSFGQQMMEKSKALELEEDPKFYTDQEYIIIPVTFHNILFDAASHVEDSVVEEQLQILNDAFTVSDSDIIAVPGSFRSIVGNPKIKFCIATIDEDGDSTSIVHRKATTVPLFTDAEFAKASANGGYDPWNTNKYLNIWIAMMDSANYGTAVTPTNYEQIEGVVVNRLYFGNNGQAPFNEGKALVRLVGQYLGLLDLDYGASCAGNSDSTCAIEGDRICDTPPTMSLEGDCSSITGCDGGAAFTCNYMSGLNDDCKVMFTYQQAIRMRANAISFKEDMISDLDKCLATQNIDFAIDKFNGLKNPICNLSKDLTIQIRNKGIFSEDSLMVYYKNNGVLFDSTLITSTITSGDSITVDVSLSNLSSGIHTFEVYTKHDADLNPVNDTIRVNYLVSLNDSAQSIPLSIGFDESSLNANFFLLNPDNDRSWKYSSHLVNEQGGGSRSIMIDNFYNKNEGTSDYLIIPNIDLSVDSPSLCFSYSYAKHSALNFETLKIGVSSDCWISTDEIWVKAGSQLQTVSDSKSDYWIPTVKEDWKKVCISLNDYRNEQVALRFEVENGYGNNLYLDDVRVVDSFIFETSIYEDLFALDLYPNPVIDNVVVTSKEKMNGVWIVNQLGTLVKAFNSINGYQKQIDCSDLKEGVYFLQIQYDDGVKSAPIIKL